MGRLLGQMDPNPCLADRRGGGSATGSEKEKEKDESGKDDIYNSIFFGHKFGHQKLSSERRR